MRCTHPGPSRARRLRCGRPQSWAAAAFAIVQLLEMRIASASEIHLGLMSSRSGLTPAHGRAPGSSSRLQELHAKLKARLHEYEHNLGHDQHDHHEHHEHHEHQHEGHPEKYTLPTSVSLGPAAQMVDGVEDLDQTERAGMGGFGEGRGGYDESGREAEEQDRLEEAQAVGCGDVHSPEVEVTVLSAKKRWIAKATDALRYMHMPTIAYTNDGLLVAAWQASDHREGGADQALYFSTSSDNGRGWGNPQRLPGTHFGARWSPVLFQPDEGPLNLFYSESRSCWYCERSSCVTEYNERKLNPKLPAHTSGPVWRAGGDIMVMTTNNTTAWSSSTLVFGEAEEGPIPKVVSNPPVEVGSAWVLPYWRQNPRGLSPCKSKMKSRDWSGVLISHDRGKTWAPKGKIMHPPKHALGPPEVDRLIEGTIVPLGKAHSNHLLQMFRTTRNVTFTSQSRDGGATWGPPAISQHLPNPNTKMHAIRLTNGHLMAAYNHHVYKLHQRSNLFVAISSDGGKHWRVVTKLESRFAVMTMYHYPTLVQVGCDVHVIYGDHFNGIRLATLQLEFK